MPMIGGQYWAWPPIRTRQFVFEGHTPIPDLPFTIIPNAAMRRIGATFVRNVNDHGCWQYGGDRGQWGRPGIRFRTGGIQHEITGARLALLLLQDAPIPVGATANHEPFCPNGSWCVCPTHVYAGTPTDNMLDMYLSGRRSVPARTDLPLFGYDRLLRERAARAGQPIRATRFFCEDVQEELHHGTAVQDVRAPVAA